MNQHQNKEKVHITKIEKVASYFVVGVGATAVEWGTYRFLRSSFEVQYMVATILAIIVSTFSNWLLGRLITFRNAKKQNVLNEIAKIYAASIVGLILNLIIMWLFHGVLKMPDMIAKMLATAIVFGYNYLIRALVIYKQ